MRIAVFGVGGVGGYFGGRLAQAQEDVIFIARGEHLRALQTQGLRVESIKGDFTIQPAQATDDPASVGVVDVVLVAVKAWQVPEAARQMQPMVGPKTMVVPLENGVEAPNQLASVLGAQHVLGGLCRIVSFIAGPGQIRHAGMEPYVAFGELDNQPSERVERLRHVFEHAGIQVEIPANIQVALWQKFLFIVSISGVGAVTRAPAGVIRSVPQTRQMLEQALREALAVGQAQDVPLADEMVANIMTMIDGSAAGSTASMQRDIMNGRPSELEYQTGTIVRLGQEAGVSTPVHSFIYHSLLPQEQRARGELDWPI
ncbi:MAG TPA: 2-dehydropantoate 2-reductase [Ktedonobacterales bacterium]|nr:2-dehydropantoate 2-reductase [Ktedonobacterales bacterium]